jgi:hypothetical protein
LVSLTVYDGGMGIGGNKLYREEGGKGVFLDFGKNFGKYGVFYEEFLKNRDTRGIHDLMYLDLLPKLVLTFTPCSLTSYPLGTLELIMNFDLLPSVSLRPRSFNALVALK